MAPRAPKPGTTRNSPKAKAKRSAYKVTIGDDVWILRKSDLGPEDAFMVRRQTGRTFQSFLSDFDIDSAAVVVWLARRKAGEKRLTFQRVLEQLPDQDEFEELVEDDRFDFDIIDPDASDDEEVDADEDPLPSDEV